MLLPLLDMTAQISPPGMGNANTASWLAFGVRQDLDTIHKWQSMSYIGIGRKSSPDNYDPLFKSSIFVFNHEFYNKFHKHGQYSFALSYRRQDEYSDIKPYEHENPYLKQEFRLYGRLSFILKSERIKFVPTFRQEIRRFYTPAFQNPNEDLQLRSRFRLQLAVNLNEKKTQKVIVSSEQLFSVSWLEKTGTWTNYQYKESRFSLYYSLAPEHSNFIYSLGYVRNLIGYHSPLPVHYIAFDIILENPFKQGLRSKDRVIENLE